MFVLTRSQIGRASSPASPRIWLSKNGTLRVDEWAFPKSIVKGILRLSRCDHVYLFPSMDMGMSVLMYNIYGYLGAKGNTDCLTPKHVLSLSPYPPSSPRYFSTSSFP
jgi:hypothetical protein